MVTAALFTVVKMGKQPKCPSMGEWIKKMWCIHTMEYYSALRKKEIVSYATTWRNPEDMTLSKMNQRQKDKHCMIPPDRNSPSCITYCFLGAFLSAEQANTVS